MTGARFIALPVVAEAALAALVFALRLPLVP